jgi:putative ABC transport system ATP-binding protein
VVLAIVLASQPFYFASFDIPKRIINDALQGKAFTQAQPTTRFLDASLPLPEALGGPLKLFDGFEVSQLGLLWGLSGVFLALVIVNGAFKNYVNVKKGVLGERLLRRLRFLLLDQYLRFRPEDIRGVKPSEAASIIKDEVDPIGTFAGDAFILPAFLSMQALTALVFILVQSVWLGLVALIVVLIQAVVIPMLRREQLRLTQLRQIESRKLAGRVGEIVETTPAIQVNGSGAYTRAEVGDRLATLFDIRVALFKRKYAVKYLNNLLAQVTPFFFYAIGGYLALQGSLNIGQLVAAIAAYKDLPPPIKDLIDWDQSRADVMIKYQQITAQFPTTLLSADGAGEAPEQPAEDAPLAFNALKIVDKRGTALLDPLTLTIPRPSHVALVGAAGSGRDALARVLGRQISDYQGRIAVGGATWRGPNHAERCLLMSYAGPEPYLTSGSIRDNLIAPLLRQPGGLAPSEDPAAQRRRIEAELSGTPPAAPDDSWIDHRCAGAASADALNGRMLALLDAVGLAEDVYRMGLGSRIDPAAEPELVSRVPAARDMILKGLAAKGLTHLVEPLDPERFNRNATLAENLLFGKPIGMRFAEGRFASDPYLRSILEAETLLYPLIDIGLSMAETAIEVFAELPPGDPLFERFSYVSADDMPEYQRLADQARSRGGVAKLATDGQARPIEPALTYVEARHRLRLVTPRLQQRVLRARESFRRHLPQSYAADIEFYQPDRYMASGTLQDNLLFGRVAFDAPDAASQVRVAAKQALRELGFDREIYRLGLAFEVGPSGKLLQAEQRAGLSLARALLPRAALVVLDGAFGPFSASEAAEILTRIRAEMAGRTLVATVSTAAQAEDFDAVLVFEGPRLKESRLGPHAAPGASAGPHAAEGQAPPDQLVMEGRHAVG